MVQSCFPSLAAWPLSAASRGALAVLAHGHHAWTTSPLKTRVGVSRSRASGRLSRRAHRRSMFTPGSRPCAYRTASGRGKWPNRDPIGELGGRNLYGFNYNNPIQFYDPDGRNPAVIVIGGVTVTVGQCAVLAVMTCLAIPPCRDALIKLVQEGVREIGDCCKPKKCPPCTPYAAGTTGHLGPHATSPSAPPEAPRPTHYNLFIVNQQAPPLCKCYWNRLPPHYSAIPGTVDLNNGFPALSP